MDKEDLYKLDAKEAVIGWVDNLVTNKEKADELFRVSCEILVDELNRLKADGEISQELWYNSLLKIQDASQ